MWLSKLRIASILVASAAILVAIAASAQNQIVRRHLPPRPPAQPAYSLRLEDENGEALRSFSQRGQTWVLGESGERFVIAITNPTAQRVEAVISVDGRDAVSGQLASWSRHRGYLVQPGATVRIDGFRQSLDDVATFRFTPRANSYSARMGTPEHVGIIAVAFFPERQRVEPELAFEDRVHAVPKRKATVPRPAAPTTRAERDSNIGTEYGETRTSRVTQVFFERAANKPARIITLRYDDADGLMARGIRVFPTPRPVVQPDEGDWSFEQRPAPRAARFAPPPP